MSNYTIYHNPRCSKSRQTLELLQQQGIEPQVVEYLKTPPSTKQLSSILKSLDMTPQDLMRKKESEYKESGLSDTSLSRSEQIKLMSEYPKVIERPIVVKGSQAVIGRPPENVLELIE